MVKKVNRGRSNHCGYFAHGNRWKQFVAAQVKADGAYKVEALNDEFAGLTIEQSKAVENKQLGGKTQTDEFGV